MINQPYFDNTFVIFILLNTVCLSLNYSKWKEKIIAKEVLFADKSLINDELKSSFLINLITPEVKIKKPKN